MSRTGNRGQGRIISRKKNSALTWEAAGRVGASNDLAKAKKAVELAVALGDKQLDLFK
jgi:hypothetical protein